MLKDKDLEFFRYTENIPNRFFFECFIGLTKVTKESCCFGYPVTKEKQNGK